MGDCSVRVELIGACTSIGLGVDFVVCSFGRERDWMSNDGVGFEFVVWLGLLLRTERRQAPLD